MLDTSCGLEEPAAPTSTERWLRGLGGSGPPQPPPPSPPRRGVTAPHPAEGSAGDGLGMAKITQILATPKGGSVSFCGLQDLV